MSYKKQIFGLLLGALSVLLATGMAGVLTSEAHAQSDEDPRFVLVTPERLIDSRPDFDFGPFNTPWGQGEARTVQAAGVGDVPAHGVRAVVLNVTTVSPSASFSWLTLYPSGAERPHTASVNFGNAPFTGAIRNDVVVTKLNDQGQFDVYNEVGDVDVIIDVVGYVSAVSGSLYSPLEPARIIDSRPTEAFGPFDTPWAEEEARTIQAAGVGGVPATGVSAVAVQLTPVSPTSPLSWFTTYPSDVPRPLAASVNFGTARETSEVTTDLVIVKLDSAGQFDLYNASGSVDVVIDVVGYFSETGSGYQPLVPERIIDSRPAFNVGPFTTPWGEVGSADGIRRVQARGLAGIPASDVDAVAVNITTVSPTNAFSWLTVYESGLPQPGTASLTFGNALFTTEVTNDLIVTELDASGGFDVANEIGEVDLTIDVVGYFSPVSALSSGSIEGVVRTQSGTPLEGIEVCLAPTMVEATTDIIGCIYSDAAGSYQFDVAPGSYLVRFSDLDGTYVREYYNATPWLTGPTGAQPIAVTGASSTTGIDASLVSGASQIEGIVVDEASQPIAGIQVCAGTNIDGIAHCALTEDDGTYVLDGLAANTYSIGFSDPDGFYIPEYFDDSIISIENVPVGPASTVPGINAELVLGGKIAGIVANAASTPLDGISVCAESSTLRLCETTAADGSYEFASIPVDGYLVEFVDEASVYIREYYNNERDIASADTISVVGGDLNTANATLDSGAGALAGRVVNISNQGIAGIYVCPVTPAFSGVCGVTDVAGEYQIPSLANGPVVVGFFDSDNQAFATQYNGGETFAENASELTIGGAPTTGVDAVLEIAGSMSGQVVEVGTNFPLENISVCAFEGLGQVCVSTDVSGSYLLSGLAPDVYSLAFTSPDNRHVQEFFDSVTDAGLATPVSVVAGTNTGGLNASLDIMSGVVGQVVADAGGAAIEGIEVCLLGASFTAVNCGLTDASGDYWVDADPGSYAVRFADPASQYVREYYADDVAIDLESATLDIVTITNGVITSGVDAALAGDAAKVQGVVVDVADQPLEAVEVCAVSPVSPLVVFDCTPTAADGSYEIDGLGAGTYHIAYAWQLIDNSTSPFLPMFWGNSFVQGTDLVLSANDTVTGIDATMIESAGVGVIDGFVDDGFANLAGIEVCAQDRASFDAEQLGPLNCSITNAAGYYLLAVDAGTHVLKFSDPASVYVTQYYNGKSTRVGLTDIVLTAGNSTTVNALLFPGAGEIRGIVTDDAAQPLAGIYACVGTTADPIEVVNCAITGADGTYEVGGLAAGTYIVGFSDPNLVFESEIYDGTGIPTVIVVAADTAVENIDASLAPIV